MKLKAELMTFLAVLVCQQTFADPPAARRLAARVDIKPPSQAAFLRDYQRRNDVGNKELVYQEFIQKWHKAKADGWLLDTVSYQASLAVSAR